MFLSLRSMVCLAACVLFSKIFYLPAVDVIEYNKQDPLGPALRTALCQASLRLMSNPML